MTTIRGEDMRSILLFLLATTFFLPRPALSLDGLEDMDFTSHGVILSGTLVMPQGRPKGTAVLLQGAGPTARMTRFAQAIASQGFVAFTYDKRGVGRSGGVYDGTDNVSAANLDRLADDAAAAVTELRRRPGLKDLPIGFLGISQAGWIGPLESVRLRLERSSHRSRWTDSHRQAGVCRQQPDTRWPR